MTQKDYLLDAAQQIRMALDREVNEDYEAAFSYYKNGVDLLLNGVQVDPNPEQREAVKRKTAQYLKRAEEIFISYLQDNISRGSAHVAGYSSLRFRSIRHLSSPVENLNMCRVVGVIDKVLLVESLLSGETFIIKSLVKSSWERRERWTVIPQDVPFMLKLLKYYVSEDVVFLHLEHVTGGTLFSRLPRVRGQEVRECLHSSSQHKVPLSNSHTLPVEINGIGPEMRGCRSTKTNAEDAQKRLNGHSEDLQTLHQDDGPLPVYPCVIVDTRDPLDATSDLLGNDVRIEWMDTGLDTDKVWNTFEAAQDLQGFTVPGSDVLGFSIAAQITPAYLFGKGPTLCSTVDVLPQTVRIVSNATHFLPKKQAINGFHSKQGVGDFSLTGDGQTSQFVAKLSEVQSHPTQPAPRVPGGIALDFSEITLQDDRMRGGDDEDFICHRPRCSRGLPEDEVRLWAAQILLALESLHEQGIVCQDLNPRNILLRSSGEACLTYFAQWTEVQPEIDTVAVEQMYCAPEIGGVSKVTEACDWWSLGALLFELLTGTPLWRCHPSGFRPHTSLRIPECLSTAAASLLTELLQFDPCYRLGSGGGGVSDIKCHPFFSSVPWSTLAAAL